MFGLQILVNLSADDTKVSLQNGQSAKRVRYHVMRHVVQFEKVIYVVLDKLKCQFASIIENFEGRLLANSFGTEKEKLELES